MLQKEGTKHPRPIPPPPRLIKKSHGSIPLLLMIAQCKQGDSVPTEATSVAAGKVDSDAV